MWIDLVIPFNLLARIYWIKLVQVKKTNPTSNRDEESKAEVNVICNLQIENDLKEENEKYIRKGFGVL